MNLQFFLIVVIFGFSGGTFIIYLIASSVKGVYANEKFAAKITRHIMGIVLLIVAVLALIICLKQNPKEPTKEASGSIYHESF